MFNKNKFNKTNPASKAFVWMLVVAIVVFFGGWAMTAWIPTINWSMQAIAGVTAVVTSLIGGAVMYDGTERTDVPS